MTQKLPQGPLVPLNKGHSKSWKRLLSIILFISIAILTMIVILNPIVLIKILGNPWKVSVDSLALDPYLLFIISLLVGFSSFYIYSIWYRIYFNGMGYFK